MEFKMKEVGFYTETANGRLNIAGDENYGFRPFQLLVSSIAVCSGGVMRKILEKKRISYDDIHIKADVERNPDKADKVEKVHLHFTITGAQIEEHQMEKIMVLTRKNCSMVQSVLDSIEIEESFELIR
ncbi:OsmC family protein [Robertmurraya kyonggiensis]|uniref:OsmC family protein n=1 Tax=Robertmurraya kyonggiensis TaxID=1037680 RepID=A0A4V6WNB5_9BACI|nr:OsmC family protein [Robertmurraya kyonggiensis]TKC16260.1 OsmC family protein [Robertmurraya kyonggiensis]